MPRSDIRFRYAEMDGAKIDREARTIPITFSSEYPAMQRADEKTAALIGVAPGSSYVEIMDHNPDNVDLSMLNNRGAFLDEHNDRNQIGVVESAVITDKVGRAVVKMGSDEDSIKRFSQMAENIRPHVSAGYSYSCYLGSETLPNGRKAYRFAWRGLEISSVAVPNDPTVGVIYRNLQDIPAEPAQSTPPPVDSNKPVVTEKTIKSMTPEEIAANEAKARSDAKSQERTRVFEISKTADLLIKEHGAKDGGQMATKIRSMATEAIGSEDSLDKFQIRCMQEVLKAKPVDPVSIDDCTDDPSRYSLIRGIQSAVRRGGGIPDGREGEVHQEMMRKLGNDTGSGYDPKGFQVPQDVKIRAGSAAGARMTRDMQATVFPSGGAFVPTMLQVPIIELLRNMIVLSRCGMRTMAGLTGNVVIPRQDAAATAYSVSEIAALTASQQVLGQISLSPKRVGATETYSKQFLMQSTPDAEAFLRDDLFQVIALKWDYLGLNGQGAASEPLGILNTPGIGAITFGATPTYIKMVRMETDIRSQNVIDELVYLSTPVVKGTLKTVAEALTGATTIGGSQNAIWKGMGYNNGEGEVNGYRALASNQIPNNVVILGAFNQLIQAMWGGLDVVVEPYTKAANAEWVITINTWGDFAVRHPQAFEASTDAGNQ